MKFCEKKNLNSENNSSFPIWSCFGPLTEKLHKLAKQCRCANCQLRGENLRKIRGVVYSAEVPFFQLLTCVLLFQSVVFLTLVSSFSTSHFHLRASCFLIGFFPPLLFKPKKREKGGAGTTDRQTHTYSTRRRHFSFSLFEIMLIIAVVHLARRSLSLQRRGR